jgi:SH3-like domain-containing protein
LFQSKPITDSGILANQLDRVVKAIEGKKEMHIDIDENGFRAWSRKNNQWSHYVNSRYKF